MVNASVTAHPTDLNTPITLKMCEVASQTDDGDLNEGKYCQVGFFFLIERFFSKILLFCSRFFTF